MRPDDRFSLRDMPQAHGAAGWILVSAAMGGACGGYAPQRSAAGDHVSAAIERGFGKLMRVASVIDVSSCLHI